MRTAFIILCCIALYIEVVLWIFLRPFIGKTMSGLLGLSVGAGFGVASGINPAGPAIIGFLIVFLKVPGSLFVRAKIKRVEWWRRKFAEFPAPWLGYANLLMDAHPPR